MPGIAPERMARSFEPAILFTRSPICQLNNHVDPFRLWRNRHLCNFYSMHENFFILQFSQERGDTKKTCIVLRGAFR